MSSILRTSVRARATLAAATVFAAMVSAFGPTPAAQASAATSTSAHRDYVAMGDSYSADVFVRPWDGKDGCGRSLRNYPHQIAKRLGLRLTDVTCGGAEVVDGILATQPSAKLHGPPSTPPPGGWPAKRAQIRALSSGTDYVTVGIGGNSLGFGTLVTDCLKRGLLSLGMGTPCKNYYTGGKGKVWLDGKFARLNTDFNRMVKEIRTRARNARIVIVGYPAIVPDHTNCRWNAWRQLGTAAKADLPWLDRLERRLNRLLRTQASKHGVRYADTYSTSVGHGICERGDQKWMYGVKDDLTGRGNQKDTPSKLCRQTIPGRGETCTFVHPNASGADHQARRVLAALDRPRVPVPAAHRH